jgi:hypothetical protein
MPTPRICQDIGMIGARGAAARWSMPTPTSTVLVGGMIALVVGTVV